MIHITNTPYAMPYRERLKIDNNSVYTSDNNIGTPWEPYVIDLDLNSVTIGIKDIDDSQNDDSRFGTGEWYTLDGRKVENRKLVNRSLSKGVYIHKGNKVVVK